MATDVRLVSCLQMAIDPSAQIHETVEVEEGVAVGPRTRIWARTHLRRDAVIGANCVIGESVLIDLGVSIGDRCKVQNNALLYHGSVVDDEVFIGPAVCLTNDVRPRASTPEGRVLTDEDWEVSGVRLEHGCSLGAHVVVIGGRNVGVGAMVGAGSVVTKDVPHHALVAGNPAKQTGWVCDCGVRLESDLRCPACARRFQASPSGAVLF
jgi:UDP-2-acetamido-3-amino-2,3-dideoxy-glucuronate N-acetyltransferase